MKPLLYVDGYNIIGAWKEAEKQNWSLDECRHKLIHLLEDYAGYSSQEVCVVFDSYKVSGAERNVDKRAGLTVVYTKEGETADHYIEKQCQKLPAYRQARVATSDGTEQTIILGRGAVRMSARELWQELENVRNAGRRCHQQPSGAQTTRLSSVLTPQQYEILDKIRRQK